MNNQIKILPETITNKIAAGEVIQRPASVVKELLENAIDAKAKNIFINVKGSGKRFIQITDDGIGMSEDDAMVAFERHATSKIYLYEDLDSLKTLGFRGEALASIAAIASVDLRTKKPESQEGTQVIIEGGKVKKVQPIGSVNGTSITVKNLFFYTPARRHFLKSRNTEFRHILNVVKRYAIAFPDIEYKFHHDDKRIYHVQRVDASSRLEEILGKQLFVHSIHFEEESDGIKIHGYLGKPKYSRRTRGDQYIFLNSRWIVSRTLNHAVYSAYGELIKKSDFPYYVLFIELNPNQVDVNVHPTKMEVKFRDEKRVYNFIYGVVRKTLSKYDLYPNVSFDISPENKPINTKVPFLTSLNYGKRSGPVEHPQQSAQFQTILNPEMHDLDSSRLTFDPVDADVEHPPKHGEENEHYVVKKYYSQDMISDLDLTESLNIWQLHNKYIISQIKSGMAIIDQHVAHERVLYEHAMESFEQDMPLASQQLLFPETIELNPEDFTYILDLKHYLEKLGFSFKFFGKNTVVIEAVPADVRLGNEIKILQQIIYIYKENEHKGIEIRENIAISYSCKTAIKAGDKLSKEEMNALIDQLFATKLPYVCPHGRPIIIKVDLKELDRKFLR